MSEQEKRGLSDSDLENIAGGRLSKKDEKRIREIIREEMDKKHKPKKPTVRPISAYMGPDMPVIKPSVNPLKKDKDDK